MSKLSLPSGRVKVLTINPSYAYKGVIIGFSDGFVFLDTDTEKDKFMGVVIFPLSNINYISELKEVIDDG